jgi:hypothetical protein
MRKSTRDLWTVTCCLARAFAHLMGRRYMSMEQWWNDIDRAKRKNSEKNLSQCHFVHYKFHVDWPGDKPGHPRWQARGYSLAPWHGTICVIILLLKLYGLGLWPVQIHNYIFLNFMTQWHMIELLKRVISPSQGLYLHKTQHRSPETQRQTSMPRAGFEPTIPKTKRSKPTPCNAPKSGPVVL